MRIPGSRPAFLPRRRRFFGALALLLSPQSIALAQEAAEPAPTAGVERGRTPDGAGSEFPILLTSQGQLQKFGLTLKGYGKPDTTVEHSKNKCYKDTGDPENPADGLYDISVSDEYLARMTSRGFSLRSLCLALQSGIRFDPEKGKRLPTYILADPAELGAEFPSSNVAATDELAFSVPDCFRAGLPYSDCTMNFDPISGDRLLPGATHRYRKLGAAIEADLSEGVSSGRLTPPPQGENGWMVMGDQLRHYMSTGDEGDRKWEHQSRMDVSREFPKGFGYGLYAPWPGGGPPPKKPETEVAIQKGTNVATDATTESLAQRLWAALGFGD